MAADDALVIQAGDAVLGAFLREYDAAVDAFLRARA